MGRLGNLSDRKSVNYWLWAELTSQEERPRDLGLGLVNMADEVSQGWD